jgi:hypothetical protein
MITTEMASPTHSVAAALKERTLDPLTGFSTGTCPCRLSTYITIHDIKLVENTGVTKGKKFLFLIRHPLCYS